MYTLLFLKGVAPFVGAMCLDNLIRRQGDICNLRDTKIEAIKYYQSNAESSCYRDGIFYPRCKDLENPEVLKHHNLLYGEK